MERLYIVSKNKTWSSLAQKRREVKGKGEKEIYPTEFRYPKNNKER